MFIKKIINSWQLFGFRMLISKAWEKMIVDSYRFRTRAKRNPPAFKKYKGQHRESNKETEILRKKITVVYFLHFFYPDKNGGTERFTLNLAKEQKRIGNDVYIVTLGKRELKEYSFNVGNIYWTKYYYEDLPIIQIRNRRAPRGLYYGEINDNNPDIKNFIKYIIKTYSPSIIHMTYPQPFSSVAKICKENNIPIIITLTDFCMICHYSTMINKKGEYCTGSDRGEKCKECKTYEVESSKRRYENAKWMLTVAEKLIVPSKFVADVYNNDFPNLEYTVIPHGISNIFKYKERKKTTKYIYIGTVSPLKGIHTLIKAFLQLEGNVSLNIIGDGDCVYYNKLKIMALNDHRISFSNGVSPEKMPRVYGECDCVVVPSLWYETYNFVLREAIQSGCLGICSNIGAMPEIIQQGENGFVFDPGNVQSLLRVLCLARDFDWDKYRVTTFPSTEEEAMKYQAIYQNVYKQEEEVWK